MSETAEKKPARAVNLAHPVVRGIFGLAGVVFVVVTVIDIKDGSSIGAIVRSASIALAGLVMAVFARAITERSERKQRELPGWPEIATRNPLKDLLVFLWVFGLLAGVFFLDLFMADPIGAGAVVLAGTVSLFLLVYTGALLHHRLSKVAILFLTSPLAVGFMYAFAWVDHSSTRLTDKEAGFPWSTFVAVGIGILCASFSPQFQAALTKDLTGEDAEAATEETADPPNDSPQDSAE